MKHYLRNYRKHLKDGAVGLLIAPVSNQLWSEFIDSLVDVVMTIVCFVFLIFCICIYPISVPLFALAACESDRRSEKARKAFYERMSRGDCIDWRDEPGETFFGIDHAAGHDQTVYVKFCDKAAPGWQCSREVGHPGPCAATKNEDFPLDFKS
jgi:hypothetical protein